MKLALILALSSALFAQFPVGGPPAGAGGGGSGTVTSVATGCGLSGGPIVATGTIIASSTVTAHNGNYAILTGDCGNILTSNTTATYTLAQAGSAGFLAGWFVTIENVGSSGNITVTTTTSVFYGNGGSTSTGVVPPNSGVKLRADGAGNWLVESFTLTPPTGTAPVTVSTANAVGCATCVTGSPTNHGVAVGSATQANSYTAAGTSGQVLTSNGASADPTYQAAATGLVGPLEEHTAISGTTVEIDFTTCFTSTYDNYEIKYTDLIPSTTGLSLNGQASINGGMSYDASSLYYWSHFVWSSGGATQGGAGPVVSVQFAPFSGRTLVSTTGSSFHGSYTFWHPLSASAYKQIMGESTGEDSTATTSAGAQRVSFDARYNNASAVNAFRFIISNGTIGMGGTFGGVFRCYGYAN